MDTDVILQDPYSYAILPMIVLGTVIVLAVFAIIALTIISTLGKKKTKKVKVVKTKPVAIDILRQRTLEELTKLERDFDASKISLRIAYQKMSVIIRKFVFSATGIKVQNYTLRDIEEANLPQLENLISEYYNPEFARMSDADFKESLIKTKRVIELWK